MQSSPDESVWLNQIEWFSSAGQSQRCLTASSTGTHRCKKKKKKKKKKRKKKKEKKRKENASNKAIDADAALQELGSDLVGEAFVTATITVWDENPRIADERLRLVEKVIQGRDFTSMVETVNAVDAWLGSLPGHVYANVRQPPVSTLNIAHMIPLSAVWAGPVRDGHLGAPPLFFARTEGSTPFRFSLHVGDVGHTLVVGPTGAGKSVLLALMALQFRRYPPPRSLPSISAGRSGPQPLR